MATQHSTTLGEYLKQCREEVERPLRWVERQSKERYPDDKERQISNAYLFQLEDGENFSPHPLKLKTLAEIYQVDYINLLGLAGYLDTSDSEEQGQFDPALIKKFQRLPEATQRSILKIMDELLEQFEQAE